KRETKAMRSFKCVRISLRGLLLLIAMLAILLLPVGYYVRSRIAMPDFFESAMVNFGTTTPNATSIYQRLLNDPGIATLRPLRQSPNPTRWLQSHVKITKSNEYGMVLINTAAKHKDARPADLRKLMAATIAIIHKDAQKANTSFSLVSNSTSARAR
ncbi:MAG TPA: hypothetical protein VHE81_16535, partial [Lacipirellulaceae bacterium]|nr:hypothetical protein [Lacipirellulaceae bacterium]